MLDAGEYMARPTNWGADKSENGKDFVWVKLETNTGEFITWRGYFTTPGNSEISFKTLVTMGFRSADLSKIEESDALDTMSDVKIVVEHEEYQGKTMAKVKYINDPNWSSFEKKDPRDLQKTVQGMNLTGAFKEILKDAPARDDVPF